MNYRRGMMALALAAASPLTAYATNRFWVGPDNGLWGSVGNWSPPTGMVPVNGDDAILQLSDNSDSTALFDSSTTPYSSPGLNSLRIDGSSNATMSLSQSGSAMYARDEIVGYSGKGAYSQNGGANTNETLTLGYLSGSNGSYSLSSTGSLTASAEEVIGSLGTGSFIQNGGTNSTGDVFITTGSYFLNSGSLSVTIGENVGDSGVGSFTQTGGTQTITSASSRLFVGEHTGGVGFYSLGGTGTLRVGSNVYLGSASSSGYFTLSDTANLTVNGVEYVGGSNFSDDTPGTGSFIQNGGTHHVNYLFVAYSDWGNSGWKGDYTLNAGNLTVDRDEFIGGTGTGTFSQFSGIHTVGGDLSVGIASSSTGSYSLRGDGKLTINGDEYFGGSADTSPAGEGTGFFTQVGSTHTVSGAVYLGYSGSASGRYYLSGSATLPGTLTVAGNEYVGYSGSGTFIHAGALHTIGSPSANQNLYIGYNSGSSGSYALSSTGNLTVNGGEFVGAGGQGTFAQYDGTTNQVLGSQGIVVAGNTGSQGTYNMNGGTLSSVGGMDLGFRGTGSFTQTGGTVHMLTTVTMASQSTGSASYALNGSSAVMQADGGVYVGGNSVSGGGTGTLNVQNGSMTVAGTLKAWNTTGSINLTGGTLTVGTLDTDNNHANFNWTGGTLGITGPGTSNLGDLVMGTQAPATLNQTGGTVSVNSLTVGSNTTYGALYNLSDGATLMVNAGEEIGASGSPASFVQTGGTHNVAGTLLLDAAATLTVQLGSLNAGTVQVTADATLPQSCVATIAGGAITSGYVYDDGSIVQKAGSFNIVSTTDAANLHIGNQAGAKGTYKLDGGSLETVNGEQNIGYNGAGTFTQTGGTNTIGSGWDLNIGYNAGSSGSYSLSGTGSVIATGNVYVGGSVNGAGGSGVLNIAGGSMLVTGNVNVGASAGGSGVLNISGGSMIVTGALKFFTSGNVNLSGGSLTVSSLSALPTSFNWTDGALAVTGIGGLAIGGVGRLPVISNRVLNSSSQPLSVTHSLTINAGSSLTSNGAAITVGGLANNGTFTVTGATVVVGIGSGAGNISNSGVINLHNANINFLDPADIPGTVNSDPSIITFAKGVTIDPSGALNLSAGDQINVGGDFIDNSANVTGTSDATLGLNGSGAQKIVLGTSQAQSATWAAVALATGSSVSIVDGSNQPATLITHDLIVEGNSIPTLAAGTLDIIGAQNMSGDQTISADTTNPSGTEIFWSDGSAMTFSNNATYTNAGSFNDQADHTFSGSGSIHNTGIWRKQASGGTSTIAVPFTNDGTLEAHSGTMQFNAALTSSGNINLGGGSLTMNGPAESLTGNATFTQSGGTHTLTNGSGALLGTSSGDNVTYIQTGGTVNVGLGGLDEFLSIGNAAGTTAVYTLSGGNLNVNSTRNSAALGVGGAGNGTLNFAGGTAVINGDVSVGIAATGVGAVNHTAGSVTFGHGLVLGVTAGAHGSYTISNPGSALIANGNLQVGFNGNGNFTQNDGTVTVAGSGNSGNLFIANGPNSTGSVMVNGGTFTANAVYVAGDQGNAGGNGTLTVSGGTLNASTGLHVWPSGIVNLNAGGTLNVGSTSSDNIENDGTFNNNGGTLNLAGTIFGAGTINHNSGVAFLADQTALDLGILAFNGGTGQALGSLLVGKDVGSNAIFNVNGADVAVDGSLFVGNAGSLTSGSGSGTVNVTGGALNVTHLITLGSATGGSGNLNVLSSGLLKAGGFSTNDLTVSDNASVTITSQAPSDGDDPEINGALVGGYLRDGAMTVTGGTVTAPVMKLGITAGKTGTFNQTGGIVNLDVMGVGNDGTIDGGAGIGNATIAGGQLTAGSILLGSTAGGVGTMILSQGANVAIKTGAVQIASASRLNMNDNKAIVTRMTRDNVESLIKANGITSSLAPSRDGLTTLAVATAGDISKTSFGGQSVDPTDVLVMYTYAADMTLDGRIDGDDYMRIDQGFASAGALTGYENGDLNYDGKINADDYFLIDRNYTEQGTAFSPGAALEGGGASLGPVQAVPEPASLGLLAVAVVASSRRRRRPAR